VARLSVNLNKVALLRNSRHTGVPSPVSFVRPVLNAGALGITLHPRPDERHVRASDVSEIASAMADVRPKIELNLEGYPDERFIGIVRETKPEQVTLVPDLPHAFTSEEGWRFDAEQKELLKKTVGELKSISRIVLFISPDPAAPEKGEALGADGIEIYTGTYAAAFRRGAYEPELAACLKTAHTAHNLGLTVNIGHDLNLSNIPPLVAEAPFIAEASIGHELTADALMDGFPETVRAYVRALAV
jgi:pyridoxine 5-phosphate synthase